MRKNIFIHIGPPKTGSSSIQNAMFANKAVLKYNGVLYPDTGILQNGEQYIVQRGMGHSRMEKGPHVAHQIIPWCISKRIACYKEDIWGELFKEIRLSNCNRIILSAEGFFHLNEKEIWELSNRFSDYNVKVIYYFRNPYNRARSLYNQMIKRGKVSTSFLTFIEDDYMTLLHREFINIERWSSIFEINLKSFESIARDGQLIEDFFNDFIDVSGLNLGEKTSNRSYADIVIFILRLINYT